MNTLLPTVRIDIRSAPESVAIIRATILGVALGCGLPSSVTDSVTTAVSEACNNVVMHAYPAGSGRLIFSMEVGESRVDAEVIDFGRGARTLVSSGSGLGLGVDLIHAAATSARFESCLGAGMTVKMSFDRPNEDLPRELYSVPDRAASVRSPQADGRERHRFGNSRHVSRGSLPGKAA